MGSDDPFSRAKAYWKKTKGMWERDPKGEFSRLGKQTVSHSKKVTAALITGTKDASEWLSNTNFIRSLNESYASSVSKAMDSGYKIGAEDVDTGLKMTPNNHRILDDGHGVMESLQRAMDEGGKEGLSAFESFGEWAKAYVTDLSSSAGMPVPFADTIYSGLQEIGITEEAARDLVSVNGEEAIQALLGGTVTFVALVFAWNSEEKTRFSQSLGASGMVALCTLNPATALVATVAMAMGYQKQIVDKESVKRGGFISAVGLGTSALIPGPLLLGAVPAFVLSVYVSKKLDPEVPVEQQLKKWTEFFSSSEFRSILSSEWKRSSEFISRQLKESA